MPDFIDQHAVNVDRQSFLRATAVLSGLLAQNSGEPQLQAFIQEHPYILSQQFPHCHHVFPRVKLGERFEADFFCLDIPSSGKEWVGIEIEEPAKKVVTKAGRRTAKLEHALQQVRDWRRWITENIDYARRPRNNSGLGLEDIQPRFPAWVIIGRRASFSDNFNSLRQQIWRDELIQIRSWDGVVEWATQRANIYQARIPGVKIVVKS